MVFDFKGYLLILDVMMNGLDCKTSNIDKELFCILNKRFKARSLFYFLIDRRYGEKVESQAKETSRNARARL